MEISQAFEYFNTTVPSQSVSSINVVGYAGIAYGELVNGTSITQLTAGSSFGAFSLQSNSIFAAFDEALTSCDLSINGFAGFADTTFIKNNYDSRATQLTVTTNCDAEAACLGSIFAVGANVNQTIDANSTNATMSTSDTHRWEFICEGLMSCSYTISTGINTNNLTEKLGTIYSNFVSISDYYDNGSLSSNVSSLIENAISEYSLHGGDTYRDDMRVLNEFEFDVYGLFGASNSFIVTQGIGQEFWFHLNGDLAGYKSKIYCLQNDTCEINCNTPLGCYYLEIICYDGANCIVNSCDNVETMCPIGYLDTS